MFPRRSITRQLLTSGSAPFWLPLAFGWAFAAGAAATGLRVLEEQRLLEGYPLEVALRDQLGDVALGAGKLGAVLVLQVEEKVHVVPHVVLLYDTYGRGLMDESVERE